MNKNFKKIATVILATNVVASTLITALPPVQTHAAEAKLTSGLTATGTMDLVTKDTTKVTGHSPSGAGSQVILEQISQATGVVAKTYVGTADESGDYAISIEKIALNAQLIRVSFPNGESKTQNVGTGDMTGLKPDPIVRGTKTFSGVFVGHPNTVILMIADSWLYPIAGTTDSEGRYSLTVPDNSLYNNNYDSVKYYLEDNSAFLWFLVDQAPLPALPQLSFNVTGLNTNAPIGTTGKMTSSLLPITGAQSYTYTSSDSSIMKVEADGTWTAVALGTAEITVTSSSASNGSIKRTIPVTVTAESGATAARASVNDLFINNDPANHIKDTTNQAAIDAAQAKVDAIIGDQANKNELQTSVNKAQNELNARNAEAAKEAAAATSVNELFINNNPANHIKDTTNQAAIDAAQAKVNLVTDAAKKAELQGQVDKAKTELAAKDKVDAATTAVNNLFADAPTNTVLKDSTTQAMIDAASAQVNALPASTDKTKLEGDIAKANTAFNSIAATTIGALTVDSTTVSGKGEPNGDIVIKNGTTTIKTGRVSSDGTYFFNMDKQAGGSVITATVTKASNGKTSTASTTIPKVIDYSLTANAYTLGTATLTGKAGNGLAFVRLWVNNVAVSSATPNADGTYSFVNVPKFVTLPTDKVEVVGVDKGYKEVARKTVVTSGSSILDNSLAANTYKKGDVALTGTQGSNVKFVRIWVNGVLAGQATSTNGTFSYVNAASFIKNKTDKVEVVGVNAQYAEVARKTVTLSGFDSLDNSLTVPASYTLGTDTAISGTFGSNVFQVRLAINGTVVKQATKSGSNYTVDASTYIKNTTDKVEMVAVDAQYKEVARKAVTVQESVKYDYAFNVNNYAFGDATISGTAGKDVVAVRVWVNGVVKKNFNMTAAGTFNFASMTDIVKNATDTVKVVAVNSSYKEVASVVLQPK